MVEHFTKRGGKSNKGIQANKIYQKLFQICVSLILPFPPISITFRECQVYPALAGLVEDIVAGDGGGEGLDTGEESTENIVDTDHDPGLWRELYYPWYSLHTTEGTELHT